jgi:hypothetical protein
VGLGDVADDGEASTLTSSDPFESAQTWLVGHPLLAARLLAPTGTATDFTSDGDRRIRTKG